MTQPVHPVSSSGIESLTQEGERFASPPARLEYLAVDVPEPGHWAEVADGIVWLRMPLPIDLNHINLWLLRDGDGWTLVDTGFNSDMCRGVWERVEREVFVQRPLRRIFVTHLHPDHVGLARWLQERHRVPVWMSARGIELTRFWSVEPPADFIDAAEAFVRRHGFSEAQVTRGFLAGETYRRSISGAPDVACSPADNESVSVDGQAWQVLECHGHAEGHQSLWNGHRRILISGDQILPSISSNVSFDGRGSDPDPLASYLDSLHRLGQLDARSLVLPAHGRPFYGLQRRSADLLAHHQEQLAALAAACTAPKSACELVPALFKRRLLGPHWFFAMGETIAHAEYLVRTGDLLRQEDADGRVRYLTASV